MKKMKNIQRLRGLNAGMTASLLVLGTATLTAQEREKYDADGDGWCDFACHIFQIEHRDRKLDSDGDGQTDYEEIHAMKMSNPFIAERPLTAREKQQAEVFRKASKKVEKKRMAELRKAFAPWVKKAKRNIEGEPMTRQEKRQQAKEKLLGFAALKRADANAQKARIQAVLKGGKRDQYCEVNGCRQVVRDVFNGIPQLIQPTNLRSADTISTDEILPQTPGLPPISTSLNLTGAGYTMGIWDGGDIRGSHVELSGRVFDKDGGSPFGLDTHATHVGGTMIASGVQPVARGMSPAASLDSYDFLNDTMEMALAVGNDNLNLSNHSYAFTRGWNLGSTISGGTLSWEWWGDIAISQDEDYLFGFYDSAAQDTDKICYDAKTYLPMWAAANERGSQVPPTLNVSHWTFNNGTPVQVQFTPHPPDQSQPVNPGYDLISGYAVGKNVMTVGAVHGIDGGYNGPGSVQTSSFTSFGPVDDGRIKPDIVANGVEIRSAAAGSNFAYGRLPGTSQAAPAITGSINLLKELFDDLDLGDSAEVWASTWKALVIHTADEAGSSLGPDYVHGWGLMNTLAAADTLIAQDAAAGSLTHLKEVSLDSGEFVEFDVVASGGDLKVTCVHTDPEGAIPPAALDQNIAALVNDLDLRVFDVNGNEFFPWKLNPASPTAAATNTSDNNRDNVEQVLVSGAQAGDIYTVRVTHKGDLVNNASPAQITGQDLSLIVTGVAVNPEPPLVVSSVIQTSPTDYTLFWNSVVGGVYDIETSTDLVTWTMAEEDVSASKSVTGFEVPALGSKRFWRVQRVK